MLEYLVILLDDLSPSFCCADNPATVSRLMPIDILKKAIVYGMKENLMIHYVLPPYPLPKEYSDTLEMIDNVKIGSDVRIVEDVNDLGYGEGTLILRVEFKVFLQYVKVIADSLSRLKRLDVCFVDVPDFSDDSIDNYKNALDVLVEALFKLYTSGQKVSLNLVTDRLNISSMANCGAGVSNVTVAPNGKLYLCPAFYYDEIRNIDNLLK